MDLDTRRTHPAILSHLGGSIFSCAKSEVLLLAHLIFMRVHGAFEIYFHNACKYAYRRARQKVGVLLT